MYRCRVQCKVNCEVVMLDMRSKALCTVRSSKATRRYGVIGRFNAQCAHPLAAWKRSAASAGPLMGRSALVLVRQLQSPKDFGADSYRAHR